MENLLWGYPIRTQDSRSIGFQVQRITRKEHLKLTKLSKIILRNI